MSGLKHSSTESREQLLERYVSAVGAQRLHGLERGSRRRPAASRLRLEVDGAVSLLTYGVPLASRDRVQFLWPPQA